jgi:hypothetical protein
MIAIFLLWLQERIKCWTKPATLPLAAGFLSDLPRSHSDLIVENALLRLQLIALNRQIKKPVLTNPDLFSLILLSLYWLLVPSALKTPRKTGG